MRTNLGLGLALSARSRLLSSSVALNDLRNQANPDKLAGYWDLDLGGVTLSATPDKRGAAPKAVTFSGNLSQVASVRIEITGAGDVGAGTCRISLRSHYLYYVPPTAYAAEGGNVPEEYNGAIPASITLSNGMIVSFPSGTAYQTDEIYMAKVASWASFGLAANCTLDDSLISGPVVNYKGYMNLAHSLWFNGMGLSNQAGVPAIVSGLNIPFHIMAWMHIHTLASSATALRPWVFCNQSQTTKDFIDTYYAGASVSPNNAWALERRDDVPNATKVYTGGAVVDTSFHPQSWDFDGTNGTFYRNNMLDSSTGAAQSMSTAGTITLNRFCLGFQKLGTAANTNHALMELTKFAIYSASKSAADRTSIVLGGS